MLELGLFPLGVILFFVGLAFFWITYFVLRAIPKIRPNTQPQEHNPISSNLPAHSDAVLLVKSGGLVSFINDEAREWFNLLDEEPNLERMARHSSYLPGRSHSTCSVRTSLSRRMERRCQITTASCRPWI